MFENDVQMFICKRVLYLHLGPNTSYPKNGVKMIHMAAFHIKQVHAISRLV